MRKGADMDIENLKDEISKKEDELKGMYDMLEKLNKTLFENNKDRVGKIYSAINSNSIVYVTDISDGKYKGNELIKSVDSLNLWKGTDVMSDSHIIYEETDIESIRKEVNLYMDYLLEDFIAKP